MLSFFFLVLVLPTCVLPSVSWLRQTMQPITSLVIESFIMETLNPAGICFWASTCDVYIY